MFTESDMYAQQLSTVGSRRRRRVLWLATASISFGILMTIAMAVVLSSYHMSIKPTQHNVYFYMSGDRSVLCSVSEVVGWGHTLLDAAACAPVDLDADQVNAENRFNSIPHWSRLRRGVRPEVMYRHGQHNVHMEGAFGYPFRAAAWLLVIEVNEDGSIRKEQAESALRLTDSIATVKTGVAIPLRVLWAGFLGNSLVYTTIFAALAASTIAFRSWRRRRAGRCLECGYDLRGSVGTVCPECGVAIGDVSH